MKTIKIKGVGSIEYNRPNMPQKLRLLSKIGMSPTNSNVDMNYETIAIVMENIEDLVVKVKCKVKSKNINSWEGVLNEESLMPSVVEIVSDVLNPSEDQEDVKKS